MLPARPAVLVRHLVMPGQTEQAKKILEFLASEISPNTFVNVMGQYRPMHGAARYPEINRRPAYAEVIDAKALAARLGLRS